MENAVEVRNVQMHFNMSKEKIDSIKEYVIKFLKRQLMYENFVALNDVSFDIRKGDVLGSSASTGRARAPFSR